MKRHSPVWCGRGSYLVVSEARFQHVKRQSKGIVVLRYHVLATRLTHWRALVSMGEASKVTRTGFPALLLPPYAVKTGIQKLEI